jgi:pyrrolidone-carboxylate peptidase
MTNECLIYAFGPWAHMRTNRSQDVLHALSDIQADKMVLPVGYDEPIYSTLAKPHHKIIVGLGQWPPGGGVRIERATYNLKRLDDGNMVEIEPGGLSRLPVDLMFEPIEGSLLSENPGEGVCNYLMYLLMKIKSEETKFGFLHIPSDMKVDRAATIVRELLAQVGVQ